MQKLKFGLWNVCGYSEERKFQQIVEQTIECKYHTARNTKTYIDSKALNNKAILYNSNPDINHYQKTGVGLIINRGSGH